MSEGLSFRHSGDYGDLVFACSLLASVPGRHSVHCVDRPGVTSPFVPRAPLIRRLLEQQDYIQKVECSEKPVDIDLVQFRRFHGAVTTLVAAQTSEYNSQSKLTVKCDGSDPWLKAPQSTETKGRIVIARSPRYRNRYFPWKQIVGFYGHRLLFIGLPEEHKDFCQMFGTVQHRRVKDFLEMASLIAGSDLFIGNQSSPHALALGLGHRMISEVCLEQPDCIYRRDNVQYVAEGSITLDDFMGTVRHLQGGIEPPSDFNRSISPPGLWQYPPFPATSHFNSLVPMVAAMDKISREEADKKIYLYNVGRRPEFFHSGSNDPLALFRQAYHNAFAKEPQISYNQPVPSS